jgi:hypothetical protein
VVAVTLLDGTTYTRAEMFEVLEERGLTVPKARTVSDWIEHGLIDRSSARPGAGRGKGSHGGRWPGTQVELLASLVAKREEVGDHRGAIGILANIPTFLWLGWGEEYAPLRQVRRAVGTWAENYQRHRGGAVRTGSETRKLARLVKGPGARQEDTTAFADGLAQMSISKRLEVAQDLLDLGEKVIDPTNVGREFGAPGASLDAEKLVAMFIVLQYGSEHATKDRLNDLKGSTKFWFTDDQYQQARRRWNETNYEYQLMQPLLRVAGPESVYKPLTTDDLANNACRNVINLMALSDPRVPRPWLDK